MVPNPHPLADQLPGWPPSTTLPAANELLSLIRHSTITYQLVTPPNGYQYTLLPLCIVSQSLAQGLPPELLREIVLLLFDNFNEVLISHDLERRTSQARYSALRALTQVCRSWRDVVRSIAVLWSRIDFSFPSFAAECLTLCGYHIPLHLRGTFPSYQFIPSLLNSNIFAAVFDAHVSQIVTINVSAGPDLLHCFHQALSGTDSTQSRTLPRLETLRLHNTNIFSVWTTQCPLRLPSLRRLVLSGVMLKFIYRDSLPQIQVISLRYRDITASCLDAIFRTLLQRASSAKTVILSATKTPTSSDNLHDVQVLRTRMDRISLPHVSYLTLYGFPPHMVAFIHDFLDLPYHRFDLITAASVNELVQLLDEQSHTGPVRRFTECSCRLFLCIQKVLTPWAGKLPTAAALFPELSRGSRCASPRPAACNCPHLFALPQEDLTGEGVDDPYHHLSQVLDERHTAHRVVSVYISLSEFLPGQASIDKWYEFFENFSHLERLHLQEVDTSRPACLLSLIDAVTKRDADGDLELLPRLDVLEVEFTSKFDDGAIMARDRTRALVPDAHDLHWLESMLKGRSVQCVVRIRSQKVQNELQGNTNWRENLDRIRSENASCSLQLEAPHFL